MAPASIRYKNPGAMWGSPLAKKWGSTQTVALKDGTGQGNNIAVFPTYVQGICAQLDLWRTSKHYRNKAFKDAIRIWSGGNHVESYIKFVLARVPGMTRDTIMDDAFWRSPMGIAFLKAQAWHEAGKRYPAPDADWVEAQRIVFGGAKPKPRPTPKPKPPGDEQHPGWMSRFGKKIAATLGGVTGFGWLAYLTDWQIAAVTFVFIAVMLWGLIAFAVWLFGKERLRDFFRRLVHGAPAPVKKRARKK